MLPYCVYTTKISELQENKNRSVLKNKLRIKRVGEVRDLASQIGSICGLKMVLPNRCLISVSDCVILVLYGYTHTPYTRIMLVHRNKLDAIDMGMYGSCIIYGRQCGEAAI